MVAPSKSFTVIPDGDVDPDSPVTTTLMTSIRDNDIHLEEWLGDGFTAAKDHDHDGVNSKKVDANDLANLGDIQGGLLFVEEHTTTGSAETSHTFSSLNGDTDKVYFLFGRVLLPGSGGPHLIRVDPNGVTTAQSGAGFKHDGTTLTTITASNLLLAQGDNGEIVSFKAIIHAEKTINRMVESSFANDEPASGSLGSRWAETSTNITSLVVTGDGANKLGIGSQLILFKLRQS